MTGPNASAIADDAWHVAARSAIFDGEVAVPAADGSTDFSVLQSELKGQSTKIALAAFDLLYLNGQDLRKLPLVEFNNNHDLPPCMVALETSYGNWRWLQRKRLGFDAECAAMASVRRSLLDDAR